MSTREIDLSRVCAYCGEERLSGNDPPEHPIPHAIGSSLTVQTVCGDCNSWANRTIDQPFLRDDWTMIHRARYDVRDPRRPHTRIVNPMLRGMTKDGVRASVNEEGEPLLGSRIIETETGYRILASSDAEAARLLDRLTRRMAKDGERPEIQSTERQRFQPEIQSTITLDGRVWLKAASKIALGIASAIYEPAWRLSPEAAQLREWLRTEDAKDKDGNSIGCFPLDGQSDDALQILFPPPMHGVFFTQHDAETRIGVVLFGVLPFAVPIASGRPCPQTAWSLDPNRPRADGRTSFDALIIQSIERMNGPTT